jgi:hypothetical protein
MKNWQITGFFAILILGIVLISGCTSTAPSHAATPTTPAVPVTPNLIGTWTGTMQGYDEITGYSDWGNMTISMVVKDQQGQFFSGNLAIRINSTPVKTTPVAGIFENDGKTFFMVEENNGYTKGWIIGDNKIQLFHLDDHKPIDVAIDTLTRV